MKRISAKIFITAAVVFQLTTIASLVSNVLKDVTKEAGINHVFKVYEGGLAAAPV